MGTKSKEYEEYEKKVTVYRRTKQELWKLPERSKNEYRQIALLTPYNVGDFKENFPNIHLQREQAFYFTTQYHFKLVADFIETIEDLDSKLLFLIEIKADFEHDVKGMYAVRTQPGNYDVSDAFNFGEFCQIEIDKIKELQEIAQRKKENKLSESGESQIEEINAKQYKFHLSQKVQALLYLLENAGVNVNAIGNQAEVARFIRAITEQSYKNIYDLVCNRGDDPKIKIKTRKDQLRLVKDKFYNLKSNLVNAIQNDLERLERRKNE